MTGIIGELAFCKKYDYTWDPSFGYDARKGEVLIQIKTRKLWSSDNFKAGRMGRFGRKGKYHFKTGVLVLLGETFEIEEVWMADVKDIEKWENNTKSGLHVSTFIKDPKKAKQMCHGDYDSLARHMGWNKKKE